MGMLVDGHWQDSDKVMVDGAYVRPASPLRGASRPDVVDAIATHPGRYWLIASYSCPWSHRATMTRSLKGLGDLVPVHFAHGPRVEGYALAGGEPWRIPGAAMGARHLHELYRLHDGGYTGRVTVPVLWDSERLTIVSNESADIVAASDAVVRDDAVDFTLRPPAFADEIDTANDHIYRSLNNAVYRAGFAGSQDAYEDAVALVFDALDALEQRLASSRYYFGGTLTETDIRLFPTLVRFDAVYHVLFKCCRRRIVDYPSIWGYARDLYGWRGIAETVDFDVMRTASYLADTRDPRPVVAVAPDADWTVDHGRAVLGEARIALRNGGDLAVDPASLSVSG